ncbi:class I SAM-dependent DNA methyltransferase [Chamaesiphon minutus]|uniref:Methylase involved in ubiquinone/menaquinone biosynthesis n=1 Tax=Chamaesiphon minutus (strain ATCC 27169 / PCC 6605) TaxID=1173020 RepID=K9UPI5_CHAP6|nr:class I SAM-dependent methyltransferase [Chamaesiphon minutus]AFY97002.1 methylase involved in ubiquinone/menaquinone biosynthesis [Chamaesiphon minutus PCC 6605]
MLRFSTFDRRNYRTVAAHEGYAQWAGTYEDTVKQDMDLWLLDQIQSVNWSAVERCADLGCGTGRTAAWLASKGVREIDGVDATSEMLDLARKRDVFASLRVADVCTTGLPTASYDSIVTCLVDEHLAELAPLYAEAARLARRGATYVLVGFHPFFIMAAGMPTHFQGDNGEPVAIETHIHLLSDHVQAALAAGWQLLELREQVIDDRWIETKPSWSVYRDVPISFVWVWRQCEN